MNTVEFIAFLVFCLIGLVVIERIVRHLIHGLERQTVVSAPEPPHVAAEVFIEAVHLAIQPLPDVPQIARHLDNAHVLLHTRSPSIQGPAITTTTERATMESSPIV